jgi:hypothetical protein|tara:strand:+ start:99 stop:293 length:195 start_codon:yes stop_codon:yes gene_type:complete
MKQQMTLKEIKKLWDSQPFLGRLLYLMNKVKSINQDEAEKIANLNFSKINEMYRIAIYNELNKN